MPQGELADRLHSAAIHLLREVASVDAGSGLSAARLSALSVIVYGGPLTMSELARAERVSNATVTSTVTGLEFAGLVSRARSGPDARTVVVTATPSGRALLDKARAARLDVLAALLGRLSAAERSLLTEAVGSLERMLHQDPC